MSTEEATIAVALTRRVALSSTDEQPVERKIAISGEQNCPVKRVLAVDFFEHFK